MNKIEISHPKISFKNCIDTPPITTIKNMLKIAYSGANIHLTKQATTSMAPVIMSNEMTERPPNGITMESSHIATLHLSGLSKKARQIHISPKIQTSPSI